MWVTEVAVENEGGGIRIGGFLNIKWMDDRITVRRSQVSEARGPFFGKASNKKSLPPSFQFGNTAVQGPSEMFESLWRPDLFIYGLKELKVAKVRQTENARQLIYKHVYHQASFAACRLLTIGPGPPVQVLGGRHQELHRHSVPERQDGHRLRTVPQELSAGRPHLQRNRNSTCTTST